MAPIPKATPFVVPTLIELDADYAAAVAKSAELNTMLGDLRRQEQVALAEFEVAKAAAPSVSAAVANLIGDPATTTARQAREKLVSVRAQIADHETAINVIDGRVRSLADRAGRALVAKVRPEHGRRVAKLVKALLEAESARANVERLRDAIEREGASSGSLDVGLHFLGDFDLRAGTSFHIQRVARQAREAGYAS